MSARSGPGVVLDTERVDVVAVFGDLRNFTAFSAKAEPAEIMDLLGEYYAAIGAIIDDYGATLTGFSGDGLMLLLNAPVPCADPALRAVRMAAEMQAAVQTLSGTWRARAQKIGYGMGLAKGPAIVGRIGYAGRADYTAIGSVVNLASRLCAAAADGQILVDAVVATDVAAVFPLDDLGPRPLKGFDDHVAVYAVGADAGFAPRGCGEACEPSLACQDAVEWC